MIRWTTYLQTDITTNSLYTIKMYSGNAFHFNIPKHPGVHAPHTLRNQFIINLSLMYSACYDSL